MALAGVPFRAASETVMFMREISDDDRQNLEQQDVIVLERWSTVGRHVVETSSFAALRRELPVANVHDNLTVLESPPILLRP